MLSPPGKVWRNFNFSSGILVPGHSRTGNVKDLRAEFIFQAEEQRRIRYFDVVYKLCMESDGVLCLDEPTLGVNGEDYSVHRVIESNSVISCLLAQT